MCNKYGEKNDMENYGWKLVCVNEHKHTKEKKIP